jgi:hypothetical protein
MKYARQVLLFHKDLQVIDLVEHLLEPQLVGLVDHDEEHLVVLFAETLLQVEELVELQVFPVGRHYSSGSVILR